MHLNHVASNLLACILKSNHLIGINFKDWLRNLKIVLIFKKLSHVLDQKSLVLPNRPTAEQRATYEKWMDEDSQVKCYVLASMSNELQSQHEYISIAKAMITYLQELYGE